MLRLELQILPKQSFSVSLDGILYDLAFLATDGVMSANVARAGVRVVSGQRVVAGQLVIPYRKLEDNAGNFLFLTDDGDIPFWDKFGLSQTFYFASNADLVAVRNGAG